MSFVCWYKDNIYNPTIFFPNNNITGSYSILSFNDYNNTNYPYTNFLIPFYIANTNSIIIEINTGIVYHNILNVSNNQSSLYISSTVTSFPTTSVSNYYYLYPFMISLGINLYMCGSKMYILCIPYNYLFPSNQTFPGGGDCTILTLYFQQPVCNDFCPLMGNWTLTRIIFNSNNSGNSDSNFVDNINYFQNNQIIYELFEKYQSTPTCNILPLDLVLKLQTNWNIEFPLNLGFIFPISNC